MLLSTDLLLALQGEPPPQAVLDQRPLWSVFMVLLATTLILRMAAFDFLGGVLCGLLLLLAMVIVRDGMKELSKFGLVFGLLCGVNFFFYVLPVLNSIIGGRTERKLVPVHTISFHDTERLTYTLTVRTTPFFDSKAGILYNVQSIGMLMMPLCMLLGTFLGVSAHHQVQSYSPNLLLTEEGNAPHGTPGLAVASRHLGIYGAALAQVEAGQEPQGTARAGGFRQWQALRQAFQGRGHKLGD